MQNTNIVSDIIFYFSEMAYAILSTLPSTTFPSSQINMCVGYLCTLFSKVTVLGLVSQLKAYVEEWFTGSRIAIVGVGELYDAFSVNLVPRNSSSNLLLLAIEDGLPNVQFCIL